ncbi:MAG: peptidylprolyl isomerase, partial [Gammaproteobacteria bacterium]|nr:peptidylprolyl isomerase [Gammaproteobacteria bacterium]
MNSAAIIASSEQEWPIIKVNGVVVAPDEIAMEMQYHPADSREDAVYLAAQALVIRELLKQRIAELGLQVEVQAGESEEEAAIRTLLEQEVILPDTDEASLMRYYEANPERFMSAPLVAARHILLAAAPDDPVERSQQREAAEAIIARLQQGESFEVLASSTSECPSRSQGGALGQLSRGQTVPEFERQLFRLPECLAHHPLESRYGFHVVWIDQRVDGERLPFEIVRPRIQAELSQRVWQKAVVQYLQTLAGTA